MPAAKNEQRKKAISPRRTSVRRGFDAGKLAELTRLGAAAREAVAANHDQAVVDVFSKAFDLLCASGLGASLTIAQFEQHAGYRLGDAVGEFVTSVINLEKWRLGLSTLERLEAKGLLEGVAGISLDRAELLCRLGRGEEAERVLLAELENSADSAAVYVALSDLHYHWQALSEDRDLSAAERWLYRAYDLGLAKGGSDDARDLVEHLSDVCLDRLQTEAEDRLLVLLGREGLGWRTVADLRSSVWQEGPASPVLRHLAAMLTQGVSNDERERRLQIIFGCYEHLPQDALGGYSAFERVELMPPGRVESRLMQELADAYAGLSGGNIDSSALVSEDFRRFQQRFLEQNDPMSGRRRGTLIADERAETRRRHEEGEQPWLGFLRFRPAV
jgi:hypothetical protein